MLSSFFTKEQPNLYSGTLAVAPNDRVTNIESFFSFGFSNLDDSIRNQLNQIFRFEAFSEVTEPNADDLVLDVIVVCLRGGDMLSCNFEGFSFPLLWRPKIKLVSRIYNAKSKKTLKVFRVSQSVTWREYFSRLLSFRGIFRFGPLYSGEDMEYILGKASINLLEKVKKWM
jgi:hypothetical protein